MNNKTEEKKTKKRLKLGIRKKIILSYISVVLMMAMFTLVFIAMFYESFMLSDAQSKLEKEAKDFSAIIRQANTYGASDVMTYLSLNRKLSSFTYSLLLISPDGSLYTYNTDRIVNDTKAFAEEVIRHTDIYGSQLILYDGKNYAVYIQPVRDLENQRLLCYAVPFYSTQDFAFTPQLLTFYLLTIFISSNLAIIIGGFISGTLTKNIRKLKTRAKLLAERKFDDSIPITSGDEIEELSNTFEEMAVAIKEYDIKQKTFLQNASHEFRTPITSIRGYVEGIRDGVFDVPKATDMILDQVGRLEDLVEEIMLLTKLETADGIYHPEEMTAEGLASEVEARTAGMLLHAGLTLNSGEIPKVSFIGDCDRLAIAVTNLISNAVRFSKNEIQLEMTVSEDLLTVKVIDDGPGIAEKDMDKLFVRFYKGKKGNHGLGLSIANAIVTAHRGTLQAYNRTEQNEDGSEQTLGAVFEIRLPLDNTEMTIK